MHRLSVRVLTILAFVLALAGAAVAQVTTGVIVGTVTDQTGAVVAGASVTAINKSTGLAKTVTTNEQGEYEIGPLPPAEYEVTSEASGFTKIVQPGVIVNVSSRISVTFTLNL